MATPKIYAGGKLREVRQRLKMTQRDFATKLGISLPYASQMENNLLIDTYDTVVVT